MTVEVDKQEEKTKRTVIKIGGMHCAGCVSSIQKSVSEVPGVSKVEVNLATEKATLEFDQTKVQLDGIKSVSVNYGSSQVNLEYNSALLSLADIRKKITGLGYEILSEDLGV